MSLQPVFKIFHIKDHKQGCRKGLSVLLMNPTKNKYQAAVGVEKERPQARLALPF
jgi:hypothetical protein